MLDQLVRVEGRAAVLALAGDSVYARTMTTPGEPIVGYGSGGVVAWRGNGPWGPLSCVLGDPGPAARFLVDLCTAGHLPMIGYVHMPVVPVEALARLPVTPRDTWEFRSLDGAPPRVRGEDRVRALTPADAEAIEGLLAAANPDTPNRPGDPDLVGWWGIADGDRLVACGTDRGRGDVAFLSAITVAVDRWGEGLGTALTIAMARAGYARAGAVALGVDVDNARAVDLYEHLGFGHTLARTSFTFNRPTDLGVVSVDMSRPPHGAASITTEG